MDISRWGRGLAEPLASCLAALGKMFGPDGRCFSNLAGTGAADGLKMPGSAPGGRDL